SSWWRGLLGGAAVYRCALLLLSARLRPFIIAANQPAFLVLVAQGVATDVQELGSVGLVVVAWAHGQFDHGVLHLCQRCAAFGNMKPGKRAAVGQGLFT